MPGVLCIHRHRNHHTDKKTPPKKVVLSGPEQGLSVLHDSMSGVHWHSTGVGMGVRAAKIPDVIEHFEGEESLLFLYSSFLSPRLPPPAAHAGKKEELANVSGRKDLIHIFRDEAPAAAMVFNYNPSSFLWSLDRRVPLREGGCEGRPGKNLVSFLSLFVSFFCFYFLQKKAPS